MPHELTAEEVRADSRVCDILGYPFDFEIDRLPPFCHYNGPADGQDYEGIATDGTGSTFALWGPGRRVLYINNDAQAGVIGRNLAEAIQIISHLPHWRDLLKFSGNGSLEEMRRSDPVLLEMHKEDSPNIVRLGEEIRARLHLDDLPDPVRTLHTAVSTLSPKQVANLRYGGFCDPLFGPNPIDGLLRRLERRKSKNADAPPTE